MTPEQIAKRRSALDNNVLALLSRSECYELLDEAQRADRLAAWIRAERRRNLPAFIDLLCRTRTPTPTNDEVLGFVRDYDDFTERICKGEVKAT